MLDALIYLYIYII